jgi:iron complex outermembrane receptor protein
MPLRRQRLCLAIAMVSASSSALAQSAAVEPSATNLDAVVVTATPLRSSAESLAQPVEVLYGTELENRKASNLGDTVNKLPGVQTTYFGTGVGRPIIRGQEGPRVQVLSGGLGSLDVSTVSADHAVTIEPFLADQIEVLKGPANLLFGSGAIGGAVNVVDGRIAERLPEEPLSGRAEIRGNTVNDERTGMFRLDGVNGNWVLHVDGLVRSTDDYEIPGFAAIPEVHDEEGHEEDEHEEEEEEQQFGVLGNSSIKTRAGAVGATWLGERGHFGLALSTYRTNYGIPGGAHAHEEEHEGEEHEEEEEGEEEEGAVRIDMKQNRTDLRAGINNPLPFLQSVNVRAAYNDYEHLELEGGLPATLFTNKGYEGRLEAVQVERNGWRGAFGLQFGHTDFAAIGDEAFVPPAQSQTLGVFVIQEKDFGPWKLELGARQERAELEAQGQQQRSFDATSLSTAAIWRLNPVFDLRLGLDHSERAPTNEELFSFGEHVATQSIEIGDRDLETERGLRGEIGLHAHTDRSDFKVAVYQTRYKDYVYLADTGIEEELPVRLWTQSDATFTGAEAEVRVTLTESDAGLFDLRVFGDYVRGELDGSGSRNVVVLVPHEGEVEEFETEIALGGNLPRIAPGRVGADLGWSLGGWRASLGAVRYGRQDRVAANEEESSGYTLVDASLAYRWDRAASSYEVFLNGNNLTDEEARPHTSLLREFAPLPGRAVAFGVRVFF